MVSPTRSPGVLVLLVEDHPLVRQALEHALRLEGLGCLTAATAAEARELLHTRRGELDLVVADRRLPDGDGARLLAEAARGPRPLPGILVSGEPADAAPELPAGTVVLGKPFLPGDLTAAIERVLGSGPAPPPDA